MTDAPHSTHPATLVDRVREVLARSDGFDFESLEQHDYQIQAAALLAVLPAPVDRAAVLTEVADVYDQLLKDMGADVNKDPRYWTGVHHVVTGLRRLAAEATPKPTADEQPAEAYPPQHRWRIELFDYLAEEWVPGGTRYPYRHKAMERCQAMREKAPTWKEGPPVQRRVVRETTTYTVEQPDDIQCGPVPDECGDEPCANHERQQAHAEGEHALCGPECPDAPPALTPCTCRQAVHAQEHTNRPVDDCPWCTPAPNIRPNRAPGIQTVDARLLGANPSTPPDTERILAYRSALPGAQSLYCTRHTDELGTGVIPLTTDDLPDGGLCASCGADVLIPQEGGTK
ncbi:hypothetical protein [Streptomyces pseudovenezuelae]|uniref:hypothetical protein n=1 Tax=Streptomyces pseudovenezuelae TaxID=67350 RepID=UPI002E804913|nr:hypothetical protein [Streptomyces pseudovenezuelae]WUA94490.1 hypothetical protein OHO81_44760 [Streptomyces pseudovenezuelae]